MTFKIGDRVQFVTPEQYMAQANWAACHGAVGTVVDIDNGHDMTIRLDEPRPEGGGNWGNASCIVDGLDPIYFVPYIDVDLTDPAKIEAWLADDT